MVRVNLIHPKYLTDQHLIAEYLEIIMLVEHAKKHPPTEKTKVKDYKLGKGHINFFKDKLKYLTERHELLKKEMKKRGFATNKTINLKEVDEKQINNWKPNDAHLKIIKKRIIEKINKKPKWYRHYGKRVGKTKLIKLTKNAKL